MNLRKIEFENFGSFAYPQVIHFSSGLTFIVGENLDSTDYANSNGSGKTTILDAISWGLYGRTPLGALKDSLINVNRDKCAVKIELDDLTIIREKTKGKSERLRWCDSDGIWCEGDLKITQKKLEDKFGMDFDTFCNTLYITRSSNTVRFLESTPSQRSKILESLVDDSLFQKAGEIISDEIKRLEEEILEWGYASKSIEKQQEAIKDDIIRLRDQLLSFEEQDKMRRRRVASKLSNLKREAVEYKKILESAPETPLGELRKNESALKIRLQTLKDRRAGIKTVMDAMDLSLSEGAICPTCHHKLTEDDVINLEDLNEQMKLELQEIGEEMLSVEVAFNELQEDIEATKEFQRKQKYAKQELQRILAEAQKLKDELMPADTSNLKMMIEEKQAQLKDYDKELKTIRENIYQNQEEIPILKELKSAFKKDIRNLLLDRIRSGLDSYANLYLRNLLGSGYKFDFPYRTKTGKEKFDITLSDNGVVRPIERYSGGERWRATFALLLALRKVILDSNKSQADWVLIDDPLGDLDSQGARIFLTTLQSMVVNNIIKQAIITLPTILDGISTENQILVRKEQGISSLQC